MQVFKNEGLQLLQTTAQALENYSFLFDSRRSNRDTAPHRFEPLCLVHHVPTLWRSRYR